MSTSGLLNVIILMNDDNAPSQGAYKKNIPKSRRTSGHCMTRRDDQVKSGFFKEYSILLCLTDFVLCFLLKGNSHRN